MHAALALAANVQPDKGHRAVHCSSTLACTNWPATDRTRKAAHSRTLSCEVPHDCFDPAAAPDRTSGWRHKARQPLLRSATALPHERDGPLVACWATPLSPLRIAGQPRPNSESDRLT